MDNKCNSSINRGVGSWISAPVQARGRLFAGIQKRGLRKLLPLFIEKIPINSD